MNGVLAEHYSVNTPHLICPFARDWAVSSLEYFIYIQLLWTFFSKILFLNVCLYLQWVDTIEWNPCSPGEMSDSPSASQFSKVVSSGSVCSVNYRGWSTSCLTFTNIWCCPSLRFQHSSGIQWCSLICISLMKSDVQEFGFGYEPIACLFIGLCLINL